MTLSHMYSLMTSFDNTRDFLLFVFFLGGGGALMIMSVYC